jgi:Fur family ferric uptake transcriptional regulator
VIDSNLKEKIVTRLQSRGLRMTHQRSAIIDAAFSTTDHYTAEELLAAARKTDPSVSRATIYRTLPLLVETGLLHELDLGKDHKVYDPNYATHPTHNHLICVDCHKIVEFEDDLLEEWENRITQKLGFRPTSKHLRIEASCEQLKTAGACKNACK